MSIFSSVGSFFRNLFPPAKVSYPAQQQKQQKQTAGVGNVSMPFTTPKARASSNRGASGSWSPSYNLSLGSGSMYSDPSGYSNSGGGGGGGYSEPIRTYKPKYAGIATPAMKRASTDPNSPYSTGYLPDGTPVRNYAQVDASYGGSYDGSVPERMVLQGDDAKQYAKGAGMVGGLNLEGMTYEEADQAIDQYRDIQKGQTSSALTSSVFSPDATSNIGSRVKGMALSVDDTNNDTWRSTVSKKEDVDNLLKSTADDIASQFGTLEEANMAYNTNPSIRKSFDTYGQYGGSDELLAEAFSKKQSKVEQPNTQSTMEYKANLEQQQEAKQTEGIMDGNKLITNEIARTAKIPEQYKDLYFGDAGIWTQKLNLGLQKAEAIKQKLATETQDVNRQAKLLIEKNNADLDVAKNKVEVNRLNAKNYMTGMLAKLGALNTTSAAVDAITLLDQKYHAQATQLEQEVRMKNSEIQSELQTKISKMTSDSFDKIQAIQEDLSKDKDTVIKDIMKEKLDSEKKIYDLSIKLSDRMDKNNKAYSINATGLAEDYVSQFNSALSQGFAPETIAKTLSAPMSKTDSKLSDEIKIKDPRAITYFRTLPEKYKNEWKQFVFNEDKYYTLFELQQDYEGWKLQNQELQNDKKVTKATTSNRTNW